MRFAQVLYNKAHWIFETDEQPQFAPNIVLVDITDKPEVKEGWDYDASTNTFNEPFNEEDFLNSLLPSEDESAKAERQLETLELLIELGVI